MENKNISVEVEPQNDICKEIMRKAIDEYGLIPLFGVCTCVIIGAGIGGLIGVKMWIK